MIRLMWKRLMKIVQRDRKNILFTIIQVRVVTWKQIMTISSKKNSFLAKLQRKKMLNNYKLSMLKKSAKRLEGERKSAIERFKWVLIQTISASLKAAMKKNTE